VAPPRKNGKEARREKAEAKFPSARDVGTANPIQIPEKEDKGSEPRTKKEGESGGKLAISLNLKKRAWEGQ